MVKVRRRRTLDCVVGGYLGPPDAPSALLLGVYEDGELRHIGQTGRLADA